MNGQSPKLNGRTPAVALVIAITSLIPSVTGLVTAIRDSGEDDAAMAYQLLAQRIDFLEKQIAKSEEAYASEIADLEEDLEQAREMTRKMVNWVKVLEDQIGTMPTAVASRPPSRRPAAASLPIEKPTAEDLLIDLDIEDEEEAEEPELPAPQIQQQSPLPPSLDSAKAKQ